MILEGIVTTVAPDGTINIAPMGPRIESPPDVELSRFLLRPFRTSHTYTNLRSHGEGVLHVTDDVLLLARAAIGLLDPPPALQPAAHVRGWILPGACRYHEFHVTHWDDREERAECEAVVVHTGRLRDFFGFNRAKHAVVEAAILATRTAFLPRSEIAAEFRRLEVLVDKTGGPQEREAFEVLQKAVAGSQ
jgi:hypothetical protein